MKRHSTGGKPPKSPKPPKTPKLPTRNATEGDRKVGYKNPPVHTQFPKGVSGNPKGRPKGRRSLAKKVEDVLARKVALTENGKKKVLAADDAILVRYLQAALKGDIRSAAFLFGMRERYPLPEGEAPLETGLSAEDRAIVDYLLGSLGGGEQQT